ncbi:MAG: hypothetical protein E7172_04870 [Firmicutes bacterium]|nr:hypothetical protein [Bacillota bacterium]
MSKNKNNVLYSGCLCPVILTVDDLYSFIMNDKFLTINYKELIFQYAMLKYKTNDGIILGAVIRDEIITFMIITFEEDTKDSKKWCMIRYYYQPDLYNFEEYSLDRLLKCVIKKAEEKKCNFIGVPKSVVSKMKCDYNIDKKWFKYNFIKCFYKVYSPDGGSETIHICRGNEYSNYESDDDIISRLYYENKMNYYEYDLKEKNYQYDDLNFRKFLDEVVLLEKKFNHKNSFKGK